MKQTICQLIKSASGPTGSSGAQQRWRRMRDKSAPPPSHTQPHPHPLPHLALVSNERPVRTSAYTIVPPSGINGTISIKAASKRTNFKWRRKSKLRFLHFVFSSLARNVEHILFFFFFSSVPRSAAEEARHETFSFFFLSRSKIRFRVDI